jgi:3-oxoacyl-[acyl-carrier protein] reductase
MQIHFANKTALVTGANRNTGAIIARTLSQSGANVVLHSNHSDDSAAEVAAGLNNSVVVEGDIATEAGCNALLEQLRSLDLAVDILVNNYGTASFGHAAGSG